MILSKSYEGTESCSIIGFAEKKLFRIKVSGGPKSPPAWYRVKDALSGLRKCLITKGLLKC